MKIGCDLIRDMLPLYVEGLTSEESNQVIGRHLSECAGCAEAAKTLRVPVKLPQEADTGAMEHLKCSIHKRRILSCLLAFLLTASVLFAAFFYLTTPEYLSAGDAIEDVFAMDGKVYVSFTEEVDRFEAYYEEDSEESGVSVNIMAERYRWSSLFRKQPVRLTLPITLTLEDCRVWYCTAEAGKDDIVLWGDEISGGRQTLPRLAMNYYVYIAVAAGCVTMLAALPLRKKRGFLTIVCVCAFFWSFAASAWLCGGGSLVTYDIVRQIIGTGILTVLIWGSFVTVLQLVKLKKQDKGL